MVTSIGSRLNTPQPHTVLRTAIAQLAWVFEQAPETMTPQQLVQAYEVIKDLEKKVEQRKEPLRKALIAVLPEVGTPTPETAEKSHPSYKAEFGALLASRSTSVPKAVQEDILVKFCADAGLSEDEYTSKKPVLDRAKVARLIETGRLDNTEIEALKKPTHTIRITRKKGF